MAAITVRAPTRTISERRRAGDTGWKSRIARAGLAALLLAIGASSHRGTHDTHPSAKTIQKISAKKLLLTLYHRISQDRVVAISAGVTFYALLAIFPAIAALVSTYGLFVDLKTINGDLTALAAIMPGGAIDVVNEQIKRLVANGSKTLGFAALLGIAISVWSANAGVKAMFDALNIVLKEQETRSFIRLNATSLAFTVGGLVFVLLAIGFVLGVPILLKATGLNINLDRLLDIGRWPVLWAVLALAIALLYRFGPSRNDIPWRWITWGSALASLVWLVASMTFSWYAANFGTYNKTYGSLGAVIGFMTWIWISAIIVLVGEELNETLEKLQHPHKKKNKPHPLGVGGKAQTSSSADLPE